MLSLPPGFSPLSRNAKPPGLRVLALFLALSPLGCAGDPELDLGDEESSEVAADSPRSPPKPPKTAPRSAPPATVPGRPPKTPADLAAEKPARAPLAQSKAARLIIQDLQDPRRADAAFRKIWEVPRAAIPALIEEVENPASSKVERLEILVLERDFVGHSKQFLANRIHGLGKMEVVEEVEQGDLRIVSQEYTKMSYGLTRNKKHYKVVIDKFGGFPVGVVVRAGLINRFRSTRYPRIPDDDPAPGKLLEWWRQFYREAQAELPPP